MYSTAPLKEVGLKWKWSVIKWRKQAHDQHNREAVKPFHTEK